MDFFNKMKNVLDNEMNITVTENGARGYQRTGHSLLDFHFAVASLRNVSEKEILKAFTKAYFEDKRIAIQWLFYARDVRGGLGERRLFRILFTALIQNHKELPTKELIALIPEYGRFDDLLLLLDTPYCDMVISLIKTQLEADLVAYGKGESLSLLAKWLPSVNTSSRITKEKGRLIAQKLGMNEKTYRRTLSKLRKSLDVVECKMSADQFDKIDYEAVPSKANVIYRDAFLRHDEQRRYAYLLSLQKGEAKINAGVLFPHEIVHAYGVTNRLWHYNETLEQLWKALPDNTQGSENTIVVADGSGSMGVAVGGGTCSALSVANALAIYFAERSAGVFKNQYITFSKNPQLVDLRKGKNLMEKLQIALAHNEVANTDIHKVFVLILQTAKKHNMKQSQLPKNIVIVSDMEFDTGTENANEYLFKQIEKEYRKNGYRLPRLVFWNVNSRTNTIPIKENALGVALVSGFSTNILKMVLSNETDPYRCLLETLNAQRYQPIKSACAHM